MLGLLRAWSWRPVGTTNKWRPRWLVSGDACNGWICFGKMPHTVLQIAIRGKTMNKIWAIAATLMLCCGSSFAAYTVTFSEVGPNVVANGSGSINTAAFVSNLTVVPQRVLPGTAQLFIGGTPLLNPPAFRWFGGVITGPSSFGLGGDFASAASGDLVGISFATQTLFTPVGYVSQTALNSTATWNGTTVAGLGLVPGTYTWTWGAGPTADSFTIVILPPGVSASSIPTLSEWALIALASIMAMFGVARIRMRRP